MGFAHRGLHDAQVPENSLAAFAAAIRLGAGIECDVRFSADGVPMVFHDEALARLVGDPRDLSGLSAAALGDLRLQGSSEPIPTLAALLALVGGRVPLLIEVKGGPPARRHAMAVASLLADYHGPVGVMSFDPVVMARFLAGAPAIRRGLVIGDDTGPLGRWWSIAAVRPHFLAVKTSLVDRRWARRFRRRAPLYSWTARTPADAAHLARTADAPIWEGDGRPRP